MVKLDGFRIADWFDTDTMTEVFGIKVKVEGKWHNLAEDGQAAFFPTKKEAQARIDELKAQQPEKEQAL